MLIVLGDSIFMLDILFMDTLVFVVITIARSPSVQQVNISSHPICLMISLRNPIDIATIFRMLLSSAY